MMRSTIACFPTGYKAVAVGQTQIVTIGTKYILNAGDLTYSSVFIGKIYKNKEYICIMMCHRGRETNFDFIRGVGIALSEYLPLTSLEIKPLAIQIAPDTTITDGPIEIDIHSKNKCIRGRHTDSYEALVSNLCYMFGSLNPIELRTYKEYGPGKDDKTNICNASVDEYGDTDILTRKGMYQMCETAL